MTCKSADLEPVADESHELLQRVSALLGENTSAPPKRGTQRFPINFALRLLPKCTKGKLLLFSPIDVVGKDVSPTGIGFTHNVPIPYKQVIVFFFNPSYERFAVEAEIMWTSSKSANEFESGCRLIRRLPHDEVLAMF